MGKEQLSASEITKLELDSKQRRIMGKKIDTFAMGINTNLYNGLFGYMILSSPSIFEGVFYGIAYLGLVYPQIMQVVKPSDYRAKALAKIADTTSKHPEEDLGISAQEYKRLDIRGSQRFFSETNKTRIVSVLSGLAAYDFIEAATQGNHISLALSLALFSLLAWQNLSIGIKSDRRREALRTAFKLSDQAHN